jgi:hypothetical protein
MSDLQSGNELPMPTRAEADAAVARFFKRDGANHIELFLMHRNLTWKVLNCTSFEDFCEDVLHIPKNTAYDHIAQVEMTKDAFGMTVLEIKALLEKELTMSTNEKGRAGRLLLPVTVTRELRKLTDPVKRRTAYERWDALGEHCQHDPHRYRQELKKIVEHFLPSKDTAPKKSAFDAQAETRTTQTSSSRGPSVSSFTPPADPDPEEQASTPTKQIEVKAPVEPDYECWLHCLELATDMVKQHDASLYSGRKALEVMATLTEIASWIEAAG